MLGIFSYCDAPVRSFAPFAILRRLGAGDEPVVFGPVAVTAAGGASVGTAQVDGVTCALAGVVHNSAALARELGLDDDNDGAGLIAHLYRRRGADGLARPRGRYIAVLWDRNTNEGTLAGDLLAVHGLFFHRGAGVMTFATELPDLLSLLSPRPAPDPSTVADWLGDGLCPQGRTLYTGVSRLGVGELVSLRNRSAQTRTYWRPRYEEPLHGTREELAHGLRSQLQAAIGNRISPRSTAVILSGGLDSSVVTAVAARQRLPGATLRSYSAVFPGAAYDESSKIRQVANAVDIDPVALRIEPRGTLWLALTYARRWQMPLIAAGSLIDIAATGAAAADGAEVVLDGQIGDELFGWSPYLVADRLKRGQLRAALQLAGQWPVRRPITAREKLRILTEIGLKGAVPHRLRRLRHARRKLDDLGPVWLRPEPRRRFAEREDAWAWQLAGPGPLWWRHLVDQVIATAHRELRIDYLRERAGSEGIVGDPPLYDVDLIEYTLRLPPELGFDSQFTRPLVREAMRGWLPERVRLQTRKADFTGFSLDAMVGADSAAIERLVTATDAHVAEFVELHRVRDAWGQLRARRHAPEWLGAMWRIAAAECWLQSQNNPDSLDEILARADVPKPAVRRVALSR